MVRTARLTIAYDGTRYAGWQVQKPTGHRLQAASRKPTIQGTLERILSRILRERVKVVGSGRTDAGVHALAQVAHVKTRSTLPRERIWRSVNSLLPHDIAVTRIDEVPGSFHARFSARRKQYRYRIFTGAVVPPFIRPYVHHVRAPLDFRVMRREAADLLGRHDFRGFARSDSARQRSSTSRLLSGVRLARRDSEIHLELEGDGFLHTMVRSIAGTLIDVGRGRLPPGTIRRMLVSGQRRLSGTTAPPKGLMLVSVEYEETSW